MALIDRDQLTCIGTVARPHGRGGALKVLPLTATPAYYTGLDAVILETKGGLCPHKVAELRLVGRHWIVSLEDLTERRAAESLCGARLLVTDSQLRPLAAGEYFHHDLIGCEVQTLSGQLLGRVERIMETGANDVLVLKDHDLLIPMLTSVVKEVLPEHKRIRIDPLPGLLEDLLEKEP